MHWIRNLDKLMQTGSVIQHFSKQKWTNEMIEKATWYHLLDPKTCTHIHTCRYKIFKALRFSDILNSFYPCAWVCMLVTYFCVREYLLSSKLMVISALIALCFIYWVFLVDIWTLSESGVLHSAYYSYSAYAGDSLASASRMLIL